ncbi:Antitoxin MazE [Caballeronia terrestris]|jgi:antitoxin MazE|uniref:Antitoxin MazE n=1 Tax=Caballeronia terrestris TaxID=1226301 RepID=A0A158KW46_9BURK|nr:AbrB/MazE/SpoVT family DNA-binding domain-containing protein [Caballeronia terrestris]SAL84939.1 Antitoxin MazE [Caballeronia terrestris]
MSIQTVKRWGNSLAVRIPSSLATQASIVEGQEVDVQVEDGHLVLKPHTAIRRFSRERLIQQYKEGKLAAHEEIDFGDPVGNELGGPEDPNRNDRW